MVCGSNTPPDEGVNLLHLGVLALCQLNALWGVSDQHFQKQFVLTPLRSTSAGRSRSPNSKKLTVAKPGPSPGTDTCSGLSTKTANALGLKAIASQIEKQVAHHAHLTINLHGAAHSGNCANCVNCGTTVSRLRVRICSETRSDLLAQQRIHSETCSGGLRQSFKNRHLFSDRTVAGVSLQLFLHVSRFFA